MRSLKRTKTMVWAVVRICLMWQLLIVSCWAQGTPSQRPALPYLDTSLPVEKRVDDLLQRLTLQEKISQMMHTAAPIERLNIPAYNWWNEGLHGVARAGYATVGRTPTEFVAAVGRAVANAPSLRERLETYGRRQTWETRWLEMRTVLDRVRAEVSIRSNGVR